MSAGSQEMKALSNLLARAMGLNESKKDTEVENSGTKIILPEAPKMMSMQEGVETLQRKIKEAETIVGVNEEIEAFPLDGAHAMMQVLKDTYGWAEAVPTPGFFGDTPPRIFTLEIGYGVTTQVIWGDFRVPGIDGILSTSAARKDGKFVFVLGGKVKKAQQNIVKAIADKIRLYVKSYSIYKGKAIRVKTDNAGAMAGNDAPTFLDLSRVNEEELVFSDNVKEQVNVNLFTPIEHTEACREHHIPLKRGVLLEGKYGTGKTLTAYVTAKKCVDHAWTFIYLDRVTGLKEALQFAKQYSPAVVFAEDIDRVVEGSERTLRIDDVLNTIDGIDSKGSEIITILTTNHVENINKAMLRPGRLDAVISVTAPDAKAAEKLIRLYGRGLVDISENLAEAGAELGGQIPAVIREVVERSKLSAISRLAPGDSLRLVGKDLAIAARGMKHHLELMKTPDDGTPTAEAAVGIAMKALLGLNGHAAKIDYTHAAIKAIVEEEGLEVATQ